MTELALAEWGLRHWEIAQDELERLTLAWVRRKRFEAMLVAGEVGRLFAGGRARSDERTPDEMWALIEGM